MRRMWDAVITLIVAFVVINAVTSMLRPYAWELVAGILAIFFMERVVKHYREW